jgi:hypothetical protein
VLARSLICYKLPAHGPALLCIRKIQEPHDDVYTINGDDETGCITFAAGWKHFVEEVGIAEDSVLLFKLDARRDATIVLDFIEILNP